MAGKTNFLDLVLPANNEFNNTWDIPTNDNFVKIDLAIEDISNEIQSARFAKTTLAEFLAVAHFSDGTLRPSDEQAEGRNSPVYGDDEGGENFELTDRLDRNDFETFYARENETDLITNMARRLSDNDYLDKVLSGAADNDGAPNFLSSSGAEFLLNGDPVEILFNVGGYLMKLREDVSIDVTGADGTKYLYAQKPSTPFVVYDRNTQEAAATTSNALNSDKVQVIVDAGQDFAAQGVKPGMILRISNTQVAGDYVVAEVGFDGNADQLLIIGKFSTAIAAINYQILDPIRPEFLVEDTYSPAVGKCYIGEGEFAGGSLVSDIAYAFKGKYESPYESIDVSTTPTQTITLNHNLGKLPSKITIYACLNNDGTGDHELLTTADVDNDLGVTVNNTLTYTPEVLTQGVFDPGTTDAAFVPSELEDGALDGDVDATISGDVYINNGVRAKFDKNTITIRNSRPNLFYKDFDGTEQQAGFIKVVCE
jgi:hypothetical protein